MKTYWRSYNNSYIIFKFVAFYGFISGGSILNQITLTRLLFCNEDPTIYKWLWLFSLRKEPIPFAMK